MTEPLWDDETVSTVAKEIIAELGDWMLREIGETGLFDTIWETWPPFQKLSADDQAHFYAEIHEAIYGD